MLQNHSEDFYQLNAGAHRRRATNFNAPALTWHRAFWIEVPYSQDTENVETAELEGIRSRARVALKDRIDRFIVELYGFLRNRAAAQPTKLAIHPFVGGKIFLFNKAIAAVDFAPIPDADLSKIETDVLYSDNRVVVLEFEWEGISAIARIEIHTEYFTITTFAELGAVREHMREFHALQAYLAAVDRRLQETDARREQAAALRKFFFHDFWETHFNGIMQESGLAGILNESMFKSVFADFRGLVISDKTYKLADAVDFGAGLSWGRAIDHKLLPLFSENRRYECTSSYMLDGRALYMTTLGPQLPEAKDSDLLPLEYIFYVHEGMRDATDRAIVSKWQLGRLVDRIHTLGTVRLASLKYLPELREASTGLAGLDGYVKKARDDLTGRISTRNLKRAHEHFAGITAKFSEQTRTDTGMLYRIERSRYYVEQFNANVSALRIRRLEGYQQYDEFVRHRLGQVFDFIDRLGVRYERAVGTLSLLDQYYSAARTQKIDEDIRKIQAYGEAVLFGVLVPYYLANLADHVVKHEWMLVCTVALFVFFLGIAAWRISVFRERDAAGQVAYFIGGALIGGAIVTALHCTGIMKSAELPPAIAAPAIEPGVRPRS